MYNRCSCFARLNTIFFTCCCINTSKQKPEASCLVLEQSRGCLRPSSPPVGAQPTDTAQLPGWQRRAWSFDNKNSLKTTGKDTKFRNLLFLFNQPNSRELLGFHVSICKTKQEAAYLLGSAALTLSVSICSFRIFVCRFDISGSKSLREMPTS